MKLGIDFFVTDQTIGVVELAREVEARGFESLWVPDHPVLPADPTIRYRGDDPMPSVYGEMADPLVLLGAAAAATDRLGLATGICLVPERHPLTLAKAVSTLDHLAQGRLIFGVGAGWLRPGLALYGVEFATRWRLLEESVAAMRALWRDTVASFDGEFVSFPPVRCAPSPSRPGGPPVVIGGPARPHVLRHVARWGDGWFPSMITPDELAAARRELVSLCEANGREPSSIEITVMGMDMSEQVRDDFAAAGADRLVVQLYNLPTDAGDYNRWPRRSVDARYQPAPNRDATLRVLDVMTERSR